MTNQRLHALHPGELLLQRRMNTPSDLSNSIPQYIYPDMPPQHADFYGSLSYLAVATMDAKGRPWATLLATKSSEDATVGIKPNGIDEMNIVSLNGAFDPFVRSLEERASAPSEDVTLFAGVGVDYTNRRRNKIAGRISSHQVPSEGRLQLKLQSDQHLGNCPKYITVRSLEPFSRTPETVLDAFESFSGSLPDSCKALIARSSTVYLATRHTPESTAAFAAERDMGLNHRGGTPGFVRVYEETASTGDNQSEHVPATYLVLPDHSGNRFYQSLGNVETDGVVGLTFPDFATGDMLYVTGTAANLHENEADALMPRVSFLTRIRVTGAVYVKGAIQLKMTSDEELSPYNPPVRYLRTELVDQRLMNESMASANERISARLTSIKQLTETVRTFTFELSAPIDSTLPGGFGIFDFSEHFSTDYRHMDENNPQRVNDDYIRTWTISSAAGFGARDLALEPVQQIDITVKHKHGGAVSSFLHSEGNFDDAKALSVDFIGNGGGFSCFSQNTPGELPTVPPRMLWIAGGVGITPFMSMWDGILSLDKALAAAGQDLVADVVLVFAGRDDDLDLVRHFLMQNDNHSSRVSLNVIAFQGLSSNRDLGQTTKEALVQAFPDANLAIDQKRIDQSGLAAIENLAEREVYLCGPDGFMRHTQALLESIVGEQLILHTESYSF